MNFQLESAAQPDVATSKVLGNDSCPNNDESGKQSLGASHNLLTSGKTEIREASQGPLESGESDSNRKVSVKPLARGTMSDKEPIKITFVYPPIPIRNFDWSATRDHEPGHLIGYGPTEESAVADLLSHRRRTGKRCGHERQVCRQDTKGLAHRHNE